MSKSKQQLLEKIHKLDWKEIDGLENLYEEFDREERKKQQKIKNKKNNKDK